MGWTLAGGTARLGSWRSRAAEGVQIFAEECWWRACRLCPLRSKLVNACVTPPSCAERKATEQYWVVGLSARELQAIVCANSPEPAVPSGECFTR